MSETQRPLFNTRACGVILAGAFILLVTLFFAFRTSPSETQNVKVIEPSAVRRVRRPLPPVQEVSESYYRTIIENNLFRPLGWTPPPPKRTLSLTWHTSADR